MTPQEIYSYRFALGHPAPNGDLREALVSQLQAPLPMDEIWGAPSDFAEIMAGIDEIIAGTATLDEVFYRTFRPVGTWQQLQYVRDHVRGSSLDSISIGKTVAKYVAVLNDFWNPMMAYCKNPSRPFLAMLWLNEPNRWPTAEPKANDTYCFWVRDVFPHTLATYAVQNKSVTVDARKYQEFLNADSNRAILGTQREQNLPREDFEIIGPGPGLIASDNMLNMIADLFAGLNNGEFNAAWQAAGPFTISIGSETRTFTQTPGSADAIREYIDWKSMRAKTAEYQIWRLVWPILGRNLTPALHGKLINKWLSTGGDQKAVLTEMLLSDEAWNPNRGSARSTIQGLATHMNEYNLSWTTSQIAAPWQQTLGYQYERAPDAVGFPRDRRVTAESFIAKRDGWPGTSAQRSASKSAKRLYV